MVSGRTMAKHVLFILWVIRSFQGDVPVKIGLGAWTVVSRPHPIHETALSFDVFRSARKYKYNRQSPYLFTDEVLCCSCTSQKSGLKRGENSRSSLVELAQIMIARHHFETMRSRDRLPSILQCYIWQTSNIFYCSIIKYPIPLPCRPFGERSDTFRFSVGIVM